VHAFAPYLLNRAVTLSRIDEISCADEKIRAFIVQSTHPSSIRHSAGKFFGRSLAGAADRVVQDDVHCAVVRALAL
jgi:hypothetical protein